MLHAPYRMLAIRTSSLSALKPDYCGRGPERGPRGCAGSGTRAGGFLWGAGGVPHGVPVGNALLVLEPLFRNSAEAFRMAGCAVVRKVDLGSGRIGRSTCAITWSSRAEALSLTRHAFPSGLPQGRGWSVRSAAVHAAASTSPPVITRVFGTRSFVRTRSTEVTRSKALSATEVLGTATPDRM